MRAGLAASLTVNAMNGDSSVPERPERRRYVPLLYRVAAVNAVGVGPLSGEVSARAD